MSFSRFGIKFEHKGICNSIWVCLYPHRHFSHSIKLYRYNTCCTALTMLSEITFTLSSTVMHGWLNPCEETEIGVSVVARWEVTNYLNKYQSKTTTITQNNQHLLFINPFTSFGFFSCVASKLESNEAKYCFQVVQDLLLKSAILNKSEGMQLCHGTMKNISSKKGTNYRL